MTHSDFKLVKNHPSTVTGVIVDESQKILFSTSNQVPLVVTDLSGKVEGSKLNSSLVYKSEGKSFSKLNNFQPSGGKTNFLGKSKKKKGRKKDGKDSWASMNNTVSVKVTRENQTQTDNYNELFSNKLRLEGITLNRIYLGFWYPEKHILFIIDNHQKTVFLVKLDQNYQKVVAQKDMGSLMNDEDLPNLLYTYKGLTLLDDGETFIAYGTKRCKIEESEDVNEPSIEEQAQKIRSGDNLFTSIKEGFGMSLVKKITTKKGKSELRSVIQMFRIQDSDLTRHNNTSLPRIKFVRTIEERRDSSFSLQNVSYLASLNRIFALYWNNSEGGIEIKVWTKQRQESVILDNENRLVKDNEADSLLSAHNQGWKPAKTIYNPNIKDIKYPRLCLSNDGSQLFLYGKGSPTKYHFRSTVNPNFPGEKSTPAEYLFFKEAEVDLFGMSFLPGDESMIGTNCSKPQTGWKVSEERNGHHHQSSKSLLKVIAFRESGLKSPSENIISQVTETIFKKTGLARENTFDMFISYMIKTSKPVVVKARASLLRGPKFCCKKKRYKKWGIGERRQTLITCFLVEKKAFERRQMAASTSPGLKHRNHTKKSPGIDYKLIVKFWDINKSLNSEGKSDHSEGPNDNNLTEKYATLELDLNFIKKVGQHSTYELQEVDFELNSPHKYFHNNHENHFLELCDRFRLLYMASRNHIHIWRLEDEDKTSTRENHREDKATFNNSNNDENEEQSRNEPKLRQFVPLKKNFKLETGSQITSMTLIDHKSEPKIAVGCKDKTIQIFTLSIKKKKKYNHSHNNESSRSNQSDESVSTSISSSHSRYSVSFKQEVISSGLEMSPSSICFSQDLQIILCACSNPNNNSLIVYESTKDMDLFKKLKLNFTNRLILNLNQVLRTPDCLITMHLINRKRMILAASRTYLHVFVRIQDSSKIMFTEIERHQKKGCWLQISEDSRFLLVMDNQMELCLYMIHKSGIFELYNFGLRPYAVMSSDFNCIYIMQQTTKGSSIARTRLRNFLELKPSFQIYTYLKNLFTKKNDLINDKALEDFLDYLIDEYNDLIKKAKEERGEEIRKNAERKEKQTGNDRSHQRKKTGPFVTQPALSVSVDLDEKEQDRGLPPINSKKNKKTPKRNDGKKKTFTTKALAASLNKKNDPNRGKSANKAVDRTTHKLVNNLKLFDYMKKIHCEINILSLLVISRNPQLLKKALQHFGYIPFFYKDGFDPFMIAIELNHTLVLEEIADYLSENPNFLYCFMKISKFVNTMKTSSERLKKLLLETFISPPLYHPLIPVQRIYQFPLKSAQTKLVRCSSFYFDSHLQNKIENRMLQKDFKNSGSICQVELLTTKVRINFSIFHESTRELLMVFQKLSSELLTGDIKHVIDHIWKRNYFKIIFFAAFNLSGFFFFILHAVWFEDNFFISVLALIFALINLFFEILMAKKQWEFYINYPPNMLDLYQYLAIPFIVCVNMYRSFDVNNVWINLWINSTILIAGLRALGGLRILKSVRYLVAMIFQVFVDMFGLLIIMIATLLFFAVVRINLTKTTPEKPGHPSLKRTDFFKAFVYNFDSLHGNWENPIELNYNFAEYVQYFLTNVSLALILTNLIIGIISRTFDEFQDKKEYVDIKEKIDIMLEFSNILSYIDSTAIRHQDNEGRILMCLIVKKKEKEVEDLEKVAESIDRIVNELQTLNEQIEKKAKFESNLDEKMARIDLIDSNLKVLNGNIERKLTYQQNIDDFIEGYQAKLQEILWLVNDNADSIKLLTEENERSEKQRKFIADEGFQRSFEMRQLIEKLLEKQKSN